MSVPARKPVNQWGVGISFSLRSGIHSAGLPGTRKKSSSGWQSVTRDHQRRVWVRGRPMHAPFTSLEWLASVPYLMIGPLVEKVCC